MREIFKQLIVTLLILALFGFSAAYADVGGICAEGVDHYNHSFRLTGNAASDMVAVATAQYNAPKSGSQYGYHSGGWCAAFINDCAHLVCLSDVIPFISGVTHDVGGLRNTVLNRGGQAVSSPQAGDLVFYYCPVDTRYCHVGLMIDSVASIQGNLNNTVVRLGSVWDARTCHDQNYNVSYVRPNYSFNRQPMESLDSATGSTGTVTVRGWAFDPDSPNTSLSVHIYAKTSSNESVYIGQTVANKSRQDVNGVYGCGDNHGFEATISTDLVGTYTIMAAALDTKEGGNKATWKEINNVRIDRQTCATLDVNGLLDGQESGKTDGYGTFDVYIGGAQVADDVNDYYNSSLSIGKSYEIKDIRPVGSHTYDGVQGELKGTVTASGVSVRLIFSTKLIPTSEWQEVNSLPSNLDLSNCEVQYNNHYKKTSPTSPGSGWTQGASITTYTDGDVVESDTELSTSNTRVYLGAYYYHYCSSNKRPDVEHYRTDVFNIYHIAGDVNDFEVITTYTDSADPSLHSYKLKHKERFNGAEALCNDANSSIWYLKYKYQNRVAVTSYTWTKDSGWTTSKDNSATSVTYRFRLKGSKGTLVLPANLKVIGEQAFAGIDASVITIPNGCTTIGSQAFLNCKSLTRLNIPASVTSIAYDAFNGCDNLVIYAPQGSMAISRASSLGIKYQVTQ